MPNEKTEIPAMRHNQELATILESLLSRVDALGERVTSLDERMRAHCDSEEEKIDAISKDVKSLVNSVSGGVGEELGLKGRIKLLEQLEESRTFWIRFSIGAAVTALLGTLGMIVAAGVLYAMKVK